MKKQLSELKAGNKYLNKQGKEFFFVGFMSDRRGVAEFDTETVEYFGDDSGPFFFGRLTDFMEATVWPKSTTL